LHELGLGHGGGNSTTSPQTVYIEDYKPNYLSAMNSAHARGPIVETAQGPVHAPTYLGAPVGELDEQKLKQARALDFDLQRFGASLQAGPTPMLEEEAINGVTIRYTCPNAGPVRWTTVPGSVDWNCNGAASDTEVAANVNRGGVNGVDSGNTTLSAPSDWTAMNLGPPSCPHFALGVPDADDNPASHEGSYRPLGLAPCPLSKPPTKEKAKPSESRATPPLPDGDIERPNGVDDDGDGNVDEGYADTDADGIVNLLDNCSTQSNAGQIDLDNDGFGDRCERPLPAPSNLKATATGVVCLSWDEVLNAWGYNVYRVGDDVTRLGDGFPTTTDASFEDPSGSGGDRYIVRAVSELASQGPPAEATVSGDIDSADPGEDPATNESGDEEEEQGTPGPGVIVGLGSLGVAAWARRRR
jgi:hypothetical protein